MVSFIDDITAILPPELSLDMATIGKVTEWLQERLFNRGRRHFAEPKEIAGPASRWCWARTTDGRAASGNGYHRAHGGPAGDDGCGSTSWNRTVPARFITGDA